jgi:GT2 family glycosyltransferase
MCHPDTLGRIKTYLENAPEVAALFGSYDADPSGPGLVSRYKNLLHHYIHQHGLTEASTFWAGCGAVRLNVFMAIGGFDESYLSAAIEDIELGARLRRGGYRIRLCPDIQVTHLKHWTFVSLLSADIFHRAVPWSRLILRQGDWPWDLNVDARSRLSALCAWAALFFLWCWGSGHHRSGGACCRPLWPWG